MARDPRFDVLFEPVPIGPVTARNRFFQVPHCNGMGHRDPSALAAMRGVKAEGGWAVVSTEEVEIHPSSETSPHVEGRLWDEADVPAHRLVVDAIHRHGSLAAVELTHSGMSHPNLHTRVPPMGPGHAVLASDSHAPIQARRMSQRDIDDLRRWHRGAVERSLDAGYDIVYVYAGHSLSTLHHFLSPRFNQRTDAYGGSLENRARLLREVLEETRQACAGRAAVACRLTVDELCDDGFDRPQTEDLLGLLGELPDLWDFTLGEWDRDSASSRFGPEAGQEDHVRGLKALTTRPVVGVGRFTSPDTMVRMVRKGVLDLVGAARPSIADPFLPRKIEEGRHDDIRECIGCNVCVSGDLTMTPIRCTQNPSMGEEWRRGWHPETYGRSTDPGRVLVVGGGPAGLEAAMVAGRRGHEVVLVEASRELGGLVAREARLPGLAAWIRVLDYRRGQLDAMPGVECHLQSPMTAEDVLGHGFAHVAVATGSTWRRDGVGGWHRRPIRLHPDLETLTPDDLLAGAMPTGERVVVFDDDHFYLGGALAEQLARQGFSVTLVTPAADVSHWTHNTLEQRHVQRRLVDHGVEILTRRAVSAATGDGVVLASVLAGTPVHRACGSLVLVTSRVPDDALAVDLDAMAPSWADAGLRSVRAVGDAFAPGTIASAVWDGRRFAEDLDGPSEDALFRRDVPAVGSAPSAG
jgi:dimethylamine/trimethylamine dehydrogenase